MEFFVKLDYKQRSYYFFVYLDDCKEYRDSYSLWFPVVCVCRAEPVGFYQTYL